MCKQGKHSLSIKLYDYTQVSLLSLEMSTWVWFRIISWGFLGLLSHFYFDLLLRGSIHTLIHAHFLELFCSSSKFNYFLH